MEFIDKSHIIVMKAGAYTDYNLEEIIEIKQAEERIVGFFFWGYGGVFCRPTAVNSFVAHARLFNKVPSVYFSETSSSYTTSKFGKFTEFSIDQVNWTSLPKEVLLVGNIQAPHFAIVARNLKRIDAEINLNDYCSFRGMLPDPNKYLKDYFKYRVDKACGFYLPKEDVKRYAITITYACELVDPCCVYVR